MSAFFGMRGTGDWIDGQVPQSWRETIMYEFPNGSTPLTAIMAMSGSEPVDSYIHNWFMETLPTQAGAVTNVYIDAALSTAYVYATHGPSGTGHGSSGGVVYAKVALALAKEFKKGHKVVLRDSDHLDVDVVGRVVAMDYNGASSYVAVKLLEDDDNDATAATYNLSTVDYIMVIGSTYPQFSAAPESVQYDPTLYTTYTGIWRNTLDLARTAIQTKLRTGDAYENERSRTLRLHGIEMEKDIFWGIPTLGVGDNGKPQGTPMGINYLIKTYAPGNKDDFRLNTGYSGQTWEQAGEDWLDYYLAQLFRYAENNVLALAGDGALLGLKKLAATYGDIQLVPGAKTYGLELREWLTPFGSVYIKTHPLFSHDATTRNTMFLLKPENIKFRPMQDTKFEKDLQLPGMDGKTDGFLTEATFEFFFPNQFMRLDGVGIDNAV